jgi:hypothetical protein
MVRVRRPKGTLLRRLAAEGATEQMAMRRQGAMRRRRRRERAGNSLNRPRERGRGSPRRGTLEAQAPPPPSYAQTEVRKARGRREAGSSVSARQRRGAGPPKGRARPQRRAGRAGQASRAGQARAGARPVARQVDAVRSRRSPRLCESRPASRDCRASA